MALITADGLRDVSLLTMQIKFKNEDVEVRFTDVNTGMSFFVY